MLDSEAERRILTLHSFYLGLKQQKRQISSFNLTIITSLDYYVRKLISSFIEALTRQRQVDRDPGPSCLRSPIPGAIAVIHSSSFLIFSSRFS